MIIQTKKRDLKLLHSIVDDPSAYYRLIFDHAC